MHCGIYVSMWIFVRKYAETTHKIEMFLQPSMGLLRHFIVTIGVYLASHVDVHAYGVLPTILLGPTQGLGLVCQQQQHLTTMTPNVKRVEAHRLPFVPSKVMLHHHTLYTSPPSLPLVILWASPMLCWILLWRLPLW